MKRKTIYKLIALVLIGATVLSLLCSCEIFGGRDDTATETDGASVEAPSYTELIMIRPAKSSDSFVELCAKTRTYISQNTGLKVTLKADDIYSYEKKDGVAYLLLGDTDFSLSQKAKSTAPNGAVVYLSEGDCSAVYAADDTLMWVGVQQMLTDCCKNGSFSMSGKYANKVENRLNCRRSGWSQPIPAYTHGALDETLYSCGTGLNENESSSMMQMVENTTDNAYSAYVELLRDLGYTVKYSNYIDGNCYTLFTNCFGMSFYVYYMTKDGSTGTVRAICDRSSVALEDFCYTTDGSDKTAFYMFNLNSISEDTFLIHAADNSWIVMDGGVTNYSGTDVNAEFSDALFDFMWKRSNLKDGEKLTVSCYYLSHAHRDHFLAFSDMIERYHDRIDLQRMLANTPDHTIADHNSNLPEFKILMNRIRKYYPDLAYMKAHTGMKYQLADVQFTILHTQEDMVDYWVKNRDEYYKNWVNWSTTSKTDPNYTVYRDGYKLYDYNNASINSIVSVNGLTTLQLGDGYRAQDWMAPYYSTGTLRTDILKTAHHFINAEFVDFYKELTNHQKPFYVLITNGDYSDELTAAKKAWLQSFDATKGQYLVEGSYTTIYGFRKANGALIKEAITASYSWKLTQQ